MASISPRGGSNGLIASIQESFLGSIEASAQELANILPIWTHNQLGMQVSDQLTRSTFQPAFAPPPINPARFTTGATPAPPSLTNRVGLFFDSLNIGGDAVLVTGLAILAVVILVKA